VAGIGINVLERQFDAEVQQRATSLSLLGAHVTREALLVEVLQRLDHWLSKLETESLTPITEELQRWDALRGKSITVEGEHGIGAGIDPQGRLLLRKPNGSVVAIQSGSVEFDGGSTSTP
jgi:BirA family biotin operon repressor/biotin-[acetyl-CoA-carboxylase] ligase